MGFEKLFYHSIPVIFLMEKLYLGWWILCHHLCPVFVFWIAFQDATIPPRAATIFFGANDAALSGRTSERQHVPVEEYKENLRKIVHHIKVNSFIPESISSLFFVSHFCIHFFFYLFCGELLITVFNLLSLANTTDKHWN